MVEKGNWKLVMENNRECYHCNGAHPELLRTLSAVISATDPNCPVKFKEHWDECIRRWDEEGIPHLHQDFGVGPNRRLVRVPFECGVSMTMEGTPACSKLMGRIKNPDLGSLRILNLPHSWNHCMGDHMVVFTVWPISAQESVVTTKWLVHKDAVEGVDYKVERLRKVWDITNDQDRRLVEENQCGINSHAYQPGPYHAVQEEDCINSMAWYSDCMLGNLEGTCAAKSPLLQAA